MKKLTTEEFINKASAIHSNLYTYLKAEYVNNKTKVIITCNIHGDFEQKPNDHMLGKGCQRCCKVFKGTSNTFIEKAYKKHGIKYDYSKVNYVNNKEKVEIICKEHGIFFQSPNNHLRGKQCPACSYLNKGYSRGSYMLQARGREAILYLIKCEDRNEKFYKLGITINGVDNRYKNKKDMPYYYTKIIEIRGDAGEIYDMEKKALKALNAFKYNPKLNFKGYTECIKTEEQYIINELTKL